MIGRVLRAYPTLLRVGFAEAVAYRFEFLIWILTTNMPLVMLALWRAVAEGGAVGRFGEGEFVTYYLASLLVRLLTGVWVGFEMAMDIRQGTLALKLLRPLHPLWAYSADGLAALPVRAIITLPVLIALIVLSPPGGLTHDPAMVGLFVVTVAGAWLITFLIQATIGASALFLEKSMSLAELYFGLFSIFSGYIVPLELFPGWLQALTRWLPFRYQLSLSIELISGQLDLATALVEVGKQWAYVAGLWVLLAVVWRRGIERFQAFGG